MMIQIRDLHKTFSGGNQVLKGIDLDIEKGDVIAVIGPSGSGKTTLLRCMNFLETADSGSITFDGEKFDFASVTKTDICRLRAKTGFVFQNYNLFANKTVLQNVTLGQIVGSGVSREKAEETALALLKKVGMADYVNSYPSMLSGGQQQRVAIARALAGDPEVIYFDEPTSALDPELIGEVLAVMRQLAEEGMTMIVVTHEMNFARNVSNRVVFIENGVVIENTPSKQFFESPGSERSRAFVNALGSEKALGVK